MEADKAPAPQSQRGLRCGVVDAAVRKYFDQGHLWYYPPSEMFGRMQEYANTHGDPAGRPYFSLDGHKPATAEQWATMRWKFCCPHGFTNVWNRKLSPAALELIAVGIGLLKVTRPRLRIFRFQHQVIRRLVIMVVTGFRDRQSGNNADIDNTRFAENELVR